ncbi:lipase maturation factor family protein [Humibacter ginsenosidimutans]|uniref:Lipase maturation factor family protein n=1 Tax=Humibacter ginsenosidimutans TaxID=2599293 RepID=A0A5B8M1I3_9MICO|nr:lipase maturation factor family protein [Humibacter ginsenosidimutans]QDZ14136.1 lipase maturation factor family protein [Humibacter ginsenosidimutans]
MEWFDATGYELARQVLLRGIAAVYLVAFLSTLAQFPVLLGERGLQPAPAFVRRMGDRLSPTLFRRRYSDRLLLTVAGAGALVAASLVGGLPQLAPSWATMVAFLLIWAGYLSIVDVGQTFYAFGWESLLLEAGFAAAFLGSNDQAPPVIMIVFFRWLVFRLEFGAGMIKIRGDRSWRNLTALYYHHETQPMPGPLSWFFHHLPRWFHRIEVLGNHFAQLVVPFLLFAPQPVASIAAAIVILTQLWLVASGNFAWLNVLTIILAFSAISDPVAHAVIAAMPAHTDHTVTPIWFFVVVVVVGILLLWLSWWPLKNLFARRQLMNASFNRWHLVNAYGAFGSVTKERYEVVIEATDTTDALTAVWREYEFKGKPGDPHRLPRQYAPYHLRLDWLMWFLALGSRNEDWFYRLLQRLLEADPATLRMLRSAPFGSERPAMVRASLYLYRFSSWEQLRHDHVWWVREHVTELVPPVTLTGPPE